MTRDEVRGTMLLVSLVVGLIIGYVFGRGPSDVTDRVSTCERHLSDTLDFIGLIVGEVESDTDRAEHILNRAVDTISAHQSHVASRFIATRHDEPVMDGRDAIISSSGEVLAVFDGQEWMAWDYANNEWVAVGTDGEPK